MQELVFLLLKIYPIDKEVPHNFKKKDLWKSMEKKKSKMQSKITFLRALQIKNPNPSIWKLYQK